MEGVYTTDFVMFNQDVQTSGFQTVSRLWFHTRQRNRQRTSDKGTEKVEISDRCKEPITGVVAL